MGLHQIRIFSTFRKIMKSEINHFHEKRARADITACKRVTIEFIMNAKSRQENQ
jgi:hypothetical protein